ncbi:MAG: hypothetical protein LC679_18275, partial [Intrasporangiaceae bacterium]|nr:hypothetical protein [Intrasporangiaceae bacterium]
MTDLTDGTETSPAVPAPETTTVPAHSGRRLRVATAWLGGCSGCHMSFLDLDESLFDLVDRADIVFGPLSDIKIFPADVDLTLVEGSVTNSDNQELAEA